MNDDRDPSATVDGVCGWITGRPAVTGSTSRVEHIQLTFASKKSVRAAAVVSFGSFHEDEADADEPMKELTNAN